MASSSYSPSKKTQHSRSSCPFPRAKVYWSSGKTRTEPCDAWICVSTSIRWVLVGPDHPTPLVDFSSFRGHFSLSLERLKESAVWEDVEKAVEPLDHQLGPGFVVNGKLSGRDVSYIKSRHVQLVAISDTVGERNALMDAVRIRMSPWQLLYKRTKEVLLDRTLSEKALKELFICVEKSNGIVEDPGHEQSSTFVETMEEATPIAEGLDLLCGFVETVAMVVKKSVPVAKDVAEEVADFAKCISVVSSALQVVVMCATLAEMGMEVKRGTVEWPRIRGRVKNLRGAVVKCMGPMLHPDGDVDELLVKNMFKVQQELVDVLEDVEKEMMRDSGTIESVKRFLKANNLRKIEEDLKRLEECVLEAVQSSSIAQNSKGLKNIGREVKDIRREVKELKQSAVSSGADKFMSYFDSPSLSSNLVFDFESCDKDGSYITPEAILLDSILQLREKGNSHGAAALGTQGMGGVGKTTALKKICHVESVRSLFADGVCFMQLGQDATVQKFSAEICRCVRNFGGVNAAQEMKSSANLGDVVSRAAEWLKDRRVLLICDDLWATEGNELGYVHELKKMLRDTPDSGLLISTRDKTIARAVADSPVSFEALVPRGSKAKEILGKAAFGGEWQQATCDWDAESEYMQILDVCAGLPLALGIAGRVVTVNYEECKNASFAVQNYWDGLREGLLEYLQGASAEYHASGLKYVVQASLKSCEVWGQTGRRNYDMRRLFRSFCILEKQQSIPESTLELFWGLGKRKTSEVVRKFADLNIVKRELVEQKANNQKVPQVRVRLHDLVLELCQEMEVDEQDQWHMNLVDTYRMGLGDEKITETGAAAWWKVQDDGYVSQNLSRHLMAGGFCKELEALLNDVRWTLRRYEMGGWVALDLDFRRLFGVQSDLEESGVYKLYRLLKRCWFNLARERSLFAFNVFGHLSKEERTGKNVSSYLRSVSEHFPSPWLCPMTKCVGPEDSREQSRWNIGESIIDLAVSWTSDRVVIASWSNIHVWSLSRQEELFKLPKKATCVAISEDGKLIASGHENGSVRRWNGVSGEAVGEPMSVHNKMVVRIAMNGNLIVSAISDYSLYRWNASTGAPIGSALRGHEGDVWDVAIRADGKLIVSCSDDETVRRWDACSGEAVGSPILGHSNRVTRLAISSDGELILSASDDKTIRRWKASTGEAVGEPLRGHNARIRGLAISRNGKCFVSSSYDGLVHLWDTFSGDAIVQPLRVHDWVARGAAISPDGKLVLSGSLDGTVCEWDVSAQGNVFDQHQLSNTADEKLIPENWRIRKVAVSANGKVAVSLSYDNTLQKWDLLTGEAIGRPLLRHKGVGVDSLVISRDGTLIVTGGSDKKVRRWDASTMEAIGAPMDGHSDSIMTAVISDDGKVIVTGSLDGYIRRWGAATGEGIGEPIKGSVDSINEVAISSDGSFIVSGGHGLIQRWCGKSGKEIGDGIKVGGDVGDLVVSIDGKIIICGSELWDYVEQLDAMTGKRVGELMKWSEGKYLLEEMKRARLCPDRKCDALARKETLPMETSWTAVCPNKNKIILGLRNGSFAVCERH